MPWELGFSPAKDDRNLLSVLVRLILSWLADCLSGTSCQSLYLVNGNEETATRRLNLAQAFNPIGSLMGMFVANFIQNQLHPMDTWLSVPKLVRAEFEAIRDSDLTILNTPLSDHRYCHSGHASSYSFMSKMPKNADKSHSIDFIPTLKRLYAKALSLWSSGSSSMSVLQIMCWTFIIQYGTRLFMAQGMEKRLPKFCRRNITSLAMVIFCISRFVCTLMLEAFNPGTIVESAGHCRCPCVCWE